MARCHTGFAWTMRSHSRNSSNVIGGWTPGISFHDTIFRAVIETMTSHVVRARRSRSNTNAWRSSGSPFRNASTALFGGSWRKTRTKSTSSPSRPEARTTDTAARISLVVMGSSGWSLAIVFLSLGAESLAHVFTLGLPPLVQDGDVGAHGEVPDAHVEEVLRLIRGGDLGARRHAHLDGRFEDAALHHAELRRVALAGPSDAHRVVGAAPLHHVDTFDGEDLFERVDRPRLLDHDGHDDVAQGLHVGLAAAIAHVGEPAGGHPVGSSVLRGLRPHDAHALLYVGGGATVGEQDAVEAGPDRSLREEAARLLVDLELHRHVVDVRGSREVVEVVEIEGAVLSDELDVVVETRVPDGFHDGRPRRVNVGGQRGLVGLQELAQLVGSHVVSPIVSIPASHRPPGPLPVRGRGPSARAALP